MSNIISVSNNRTDLNYQALLQGRYEAERLPKNFSPERIVPDFAFNVLNPLGLLYRPVVDENYLSRGGLKPVWPEGRPFAVCLTHDVDYVSLYSLHQSARFRAQQCFYGDSLTKKVRGLMGWGRDVVRALRHANRWDPLHCYERWLEAEAVVGAYSTFFFWPGWRSVGKHHSSDCTYELTDQVAFDGQKCSVAEMIREINCRGWEIGLHPSWYSFNDAEEMKRQKAALEMVLGHDVVTVRQHFLHYDVRVTPRIQTEAGFQYDSTLGFNNNVGFRFGTCYPWRLYDIQNEKELTLIEVPLIVEDVALLNQAKGMGLDEDIALLYIEQITEEVKKVGGILTLLWHPNHIIRSEWWNLYLKVLKYLEDRNAWFGSVQNVAERKK